MRPQGRMNPMPLVCLIFVFGRLAQAQTSSSLIEEAENELQDVKANVSIQEPTPIEHFWNEKWAYGLSYQNVDISGHTTLPSGGTSRFGGRLDSFGLLVERRLHKSNWGHGPALTLSWAQTRVPVVRAYNRVETKLDVLHAGLSWRFWSGPWPKLAGLSFVSQIGWGPWSYVQNARDRMNQNVSTVSAVETGLGIERRFGSFAAEVEHIWAQSLGSDEAGVDGARWSFNLKAVTR